MIKEKIFFVTGASRSGTTLLSFVLRNHAEIYGLRELQYFGEYCDPSQLEAPLSESKLLRAGASIHARQRDGILNPVVGPNDLDWSRQLLQSSPPGNRTPGKIFAAAVLRLANQAGKSIPCEQTPRNIYYAEELLAYFENAHIIHIVRDPRSVMASQKKRWRRRELTADTSSRSYLRSMQSWVNYHPYTSSRLWLRASRAARRLEGHPRFTIIRFEDLVRSPESTVRGLCDRLGVKFQSAMLDIAQVNSSHFSTVDGRRKGWNTAVVDAWRTVLTPTEVAIVERTCGSLMRSYGYDSNASISRKGTRGRELGYRLTFLAHAAGVFLVNPRRAWIQLQAAVSRKSD